MLDVGLAVTVGIRVAAGVDEIALQAAIKMDNTNNTDNVLIIFLDPDFIPAIPIRNRQLQRYRLPARLLCAAPHPRRALP